MNTPIADTPYELSKRNKLIEDITSKTICPDQILVCVSSINVHRAIEAQNYLDLSDNPKIKAAILKVIREMNMGTPVIDSTNYESWVGKRIWKKSRKPFKSTLQINTVKDYTVNENSGNSAFSFYEDESVCDCHQCELYCQE